MMMDPAPCEHPEHHGGADCAAPDDCCRGEAVAAPPEPLREVLRRFEAEAARGVCDTGRYQCRYFSWGTGPALVMIPGLADDAQSFVMLAARLANRFRCISYDLPGGRGDGARMSRYTHDDLVDDLRLLLDHLGIQQSYVLGSSFGSTIALAALHRYPTRLPRGILQGGFAYRRLAPAEIAMASLLRFAPGSMRWMPMRRAALTRSHAEPFAGRDPEIWEYFLTRWCTPPIAAVARRALILYGVDLRPLLHDIAQPVLLVCGERDPLVDHSCEEALMSGLPRCLRIELPGCGHNPQFTHPEVFAELIARFLTPAACTLTATRS
jgi:pimeloyl-ACP methyl ester carboxylesterase